MAKAAILKKELSKSSPAKQDSVDASVLESKLGYQIRMADRVMSKEFVQNVGMTPVQFSVFSLVATNANLSQVEVGEALGMDRASTMAIVHKLEDAGLIRRNIATHDKRMHALQLTAEGKRKFPAINARVIEHEDVFNDRLSPDEQKFFFACIAKIRGQAG